MNEKQKQKNTLRQNVMKVQNTRTKSIHASSHIYKEQESEWHQTSQYYWMLEDNAMLHISDKIISNY